MGSIQRLIDLGIESSTVFETITAVVSQRLVRLFCTACNPTHSQICHNCSGSGYSGRRAIAEVLLLNDETRELIRQSPNIAETARRLEQSGFQSMRAAGLHLVEQGLTSMEEIDRVLGASSAQQEAQQTAQQAALEVESDNKELQEKGSDQPHPVDCLLYTSPSPRDS